MSEQEYTPTEAGYWPSTPPDVEALRHGYELYAEQVSVHQEGLTDLPAPPAAVRESLFLTGIELIRDQVRADERAKQPDLPCDRGCNVNDGPMEDCSQHGRSPRDLWGIIEDLNQRLADERAKRPDREQIDRIQFEIDNVHQIHGDTCLCGFKSSRSRSRTEHLTALFAEAVLALEPETDQELQDRIEVLEKNLSYEVAQKIKLAEQLQAATATDLTLEQARWKMHAGIESRCSEEVAAEVKPVIDLVFSSLALEPEAREDKLEHLAAVTNINLITKAMLEEVGYPSHFHPAEAPSWAYSVLEEEHEARTAPEAREIPDAEVAAAYSAFVQASFGFPGAPAMRAALEAARDA